MAQISRALSAGRRDAAVKRPENMRISDIGLSQLAKHPRMYADEQAAFRELIELRAAHLKMRDKLLALAKECAECGGSGVIPVNEDLQAAFGKTMPCDGCEDIRECLR